MRAAGSLFCNAAGWQTKTSPPRPPHGRDIAARWLPANCRWRAGGDGAFEAAHGETRFLCCWREHGREMGWGNSVFTPPVFHQSAGPVAGTPFVAGRNKFYKSTLPRCLQICCCSLMVFFQIPGEKMPTPRTKNWERLIEPIAFFQGEYGSMRKKLSELTHEKRYVRLFWIPMPMTCRYFFTRAGNLTAQNQIANEN